MKTELIKTLNEFYNAAYKSFSRHRFLSEALRIEKSVMIANESASRVFQIIEPNGFLEFVSICDEWSKETISNHHEKVIENDKQKKFKLVTNGK